MNSHPIGSGVVRGSRPRFSSAPPVAPEAVQVDDGEGDIIVSPQLHLIFWGAAWSGTPTTTMRDVIVAADAIVRSSYMSALDQYRNIQSVTVVDQTVVTTSNPPSVFKRDDIESFLREALNSGSAVHPGSANSDLYTVIMPPRVRYDEDLWGEHTYFSYRSTGTSWLSRNVRYAWVLNDGSLDFITSILSHELVEACTDPEGDAFQILPRDTSSWNEIADSGCGCEGKTSRLKPSGVLVQKYWSQSDDACVAPGT